MNNETKIVITKGCKALGIDKGDAGVVMYADPMGVEYSHSVRVKITMLTGSRGGRTLSLYAKSINRLADGKVRLNDGDPTHTVEIRRA